MAAEAHVPLARVRNFRVREGFTSGREAQNRVNSSATVRVFYSEEFARCRRRARSHAERSEQTPLL